MYKQFLALVPLMRHLSEPSQWDQIVFYDCLDLYHESPDSCERQYKPRT